MRTKMNDSRLVALLEEIRSIAQLGLNYARDPYDRERYQQLLSIACDHYAAISGLGAIEISGRFLQELGYITPKVGVSAAVFDGTGRILLVRRTDDQCWCLPCGWAEVRETPQQSIAREVLEETGLEVEVRELVRLGTRMPGDFGLPHTTYHLQFHCKVIGGRLSESHETTDVGFYPMETVHNWHLDHKEEALAAINYWRTLQQNKRSHA
jgi:ADP-ribose pyrophosphatase YjhB (NUDIX family)